MVADGHFCDARAHGVNDAGALVAEDDRLWYREQLIPHRDVGMAYTGRDNPDTDFAGTRRIELQSLDRERRMRCPGDGCFYLCHRWYACDVRQSRETPAAPLSNRTCHR